MNLVVKYKLSGILTLARFFHDGHYLGQLVFRPDTWVTFRMAADAAGSIGFEFTETD